MGKLLQQRTDLTPNRNSLLVNLEERELKRQYSVLILVLLNIHDCTDGGLLIYA